MTFAVDGGIGANTDIVYPTALYPLYGPFKLGQQMFGSDGKLYVFAKAGGAIAAGTAVCSVSPSTFAATNSGGSYTSPSTALSTGDFAWFGKASV